MKKQHFSRDSVALIERGSGLISNHKLNETLINFLRNCYTLLIKKNTYGEYVTQLWLQNNLYPTMSPYSHHIHLFSSTVYMVRFVFRSHLSVWNFQQSGFQLVVEKWLHFWFGFALLSLWSAKISRATFLTNQKLNQNQWWLVRTCPLALETGYVYLLRVLIDSSDFLRLLWLARVIIITLGLVVRHSTEHRSIKAKKNPAYARIIATKNLHALSAQSHWAIGTYHSHVNQARTTEDYIKLSFVLQYNNR